MEWGQNQVLPRTSQERAAASALGLVRTRAQTRPHWTWGEGGTIREGIQRALLMNPVPREPVNMVVTVGNKEDGILAGTEGKYSSMAASFR